MEFRTDPQQPENPNVEEQYEDNPQQQEEDVNKFAQRGEETLEAMHIEEFSNLVESSGFGDDLLKNFAAYNDESLKFEAVDHLMDVLWTMCRTQYDKKEIIKLLKMYHSGDQSDYQRVIQFLGWVSRNALKKDSEGDSAQIEAVVDQFIEHLISLGQRASANPETIVAPLRKVLTMFDARQGMRLIELVMKRIAGDVANGRYDASIFQRVFTPFLNSIGFQNAAVSFNKSLSQIYNMQVTPSTGRLVPIF